MLSKSHSCRDYKLELYNNYCYRPQLLKYQYDTCIEKPRFLEKYDRDTFNSLHNLIKSSDFNSIGSPGGARKVENLRYSNNCNDNSNNNNFNNIYSPMNNNKRKFPLLTKSASQINIPQWSKFDKNVLRFKGYFQEHITENFYENYRIRPCVLLYYLEDDTIQVLEMKSENSGIPQGVLIKRFRLVNNSNNREIHWRDFNLGKNIMLLGKNFRICSCDKFTENFLRQNGIDINKPEEIPQIDFSKKYSMIDFAQIKRNLRDIKEYTEVGLGGGHPNRGLKQFLENDRKVLSFDIAWHDDRYDKELKRYKLNYYLADGQIEVREIKMINSGKADFPRLLNKRKLPKIPRMVHCPGLETKNEEYYTPKDLILGNYINIYNRKCLIVSCDEFTKNWYKEK
jgi:hypothetical protein